MNGNTSISGRRWIQIRQTRRSSVTTLSASRFFGCDYTDKALVIVGRSPGVHSQNRGCSGLSIDDADLQKRFDIQVREISSNVISEQLHVLGAGCKLRGGLGSISTQSSQNDHPTAGGRIAKACHQSKIICTGIWKRPVARPASLALHLIDNRVHGLRRELKALRLQ